MRWSLQLGSVRGIGIHVHATFAILVLWLALASWRSGESLLEFLWTAIFVVSLFGCVVLHELGHALMAQRFGIGTRDITLLPIGGVARLERMPKEPLQELAVALAGPAVNVAIAVLLYLALDGIGRPFDPAALDVDAIPFLERLLLTNIILVVFNLIPAFPMDGGRALRAFLAARMDYVRATRQAARLGQLIAIGFAILGFMANPILIFIALFVWLGAAAEAEGVGVQSALEGVPVSSAMLTDFEVLDPDAPLARAIELTLAGSQQDFPVIRGGRLLGMLTQEGMLKGLQAHGDSVRVSRVMRTDPISADGREFVVDVLPRFDEGHATAIAVLQGEELIGLLTMTNVRELLQIQDALSHAVNAPNRRFRRGRPR